MIPNVLVVRGDARTWAAAFFRWYNHEHHHSAIGLLTPADVHFGKAQTILDQRQQVLQAAYLKKPERFVKGPSIPAELPTAVRINPPNLPLLAEKPSPSPPS